MAETKAGYELTSVATIEVPERLELPHTLCGDYESLLQQEIRWMLSAPYVLLVSEAHDNE